LIDCVAVAVTQYLINRLLLMSCLVTRTWCWRGS